MSGGRERVKVIVKGAEGEGERTEGEWGAVNVKGDFATYVAAASKACEP